MQTLRNTGWRRPAPVTVESLPADELGRNDLYKLARLAEQALGLRASLRQLLQHLAGFYGGEPIQGRVMVWPSNEALTDRTGLSERAVRYCVADLVAAGLVVMRDYANGKRFAIRARNGQIIDAYGFDLSPLLARQAEFEAIVAAEKTRREIHRRMHDQITVCRRQIQELVLAIDEWGADAGDLERDHDLLVRSTPRRSALASPEASLARWQALLIHAQERYQSACGGKSSRHTENNNEDSDHSCQQGLGGIDADTETSAAGLGEPAVARAIHLVDLASACPNAFAYAGDIRSTGDLVREAGRLAGAVLGVSGDAWREAREALGAQQAAAAIFLVLQRYDDDPGRIRSPGGYYRHYCRLAARGQADIAADIGAMRRRRAH